MKILAILVAFLVLGETYFKKSNQLLHNLKNGWFLSIKCILLHGRALDIQLGFHAHTIQRL